MDAIRYNNQLKKPSSHLITRYKLMQLVVRIQLRAVPELSHTGARDTDPPMEAESLTLRVLDIGSVDKVHNHNPIRG